MTSAHDDPLPVTVRVPGKVNLELLVGPRRSDGYHSLSTVFQAVSLYDDVTVALADDWGVTVAGDLAAGVPTDGTNLAVRAAQALAAESGVDQPVHVTVRKGIPVAGGMAGGSADAAATLLACHELWGLSEGRDYLERVAAEVGSDVPFLLAGGTAVGSGRGEVLAPVLARGTYHWVFALSESGLSTPTVFAEFDRLNAGRDVPEPTPSPQLMSALRSGSPHDLAPLLTNDLAAAASWLAPHLTDVAAEGMEFGALGAVISGSGPTVAFLVEDSESGIDLAVALTASGVCTDVRRATGPVHGAHVIPTRND